MRNVRSKSLSMYTLFCISAINSVVDTVSFGKAIYKQLEVVWKEADVLQQKVRLRPSPADSQPTPKLQFKRAGLWLEIWFWDYLNT